jgi:UDPglucose 6-dehydrogenase
MRIIETVLASNETRKRAMTRKIAAFCDGGLRGKTIALLGLTFKADTDDMREAVSIPLAQALSDAGSILKAYDPVANGRARAVLPPGVQYCSSAIEAAKEADAIVIVTEWREFAEIDLRELRATMRAPVIVDLRNFLNEEQVQRSGFSYFGIGGPRRQAFEKMSSRSAGSTRPFWTNSGDRRVGEDLLSQRIAAAE